ncbi:MAG: Lrp/AsnC family transcriptional regulator [Myxococcales bacterium]|nr:Lrp/AsnC family transcriptional regulator [Myxococcales bacterium]
MSQPALHPLDALDHKLLAALQQDASLTNQELAARVGLSPSPCLRRVKALEAAGIILRRVALLDPKKLGLSLMALVQISMDRHTPERFERFEATVKQYPEVRTCYLITGQQSDYLLEILVPTMDDYQAFLLEKITRIEGVSGVHSSFVMRRVVETTALPLQYLERQLPSD